MDSLDDFFFSSNALTSDKIRQLKEFLVSPNEEGRQYAVKVLDTYAGSDSLNIVMKSDLVTLLCDTIASGSSNTNSLIYNFLSKICRHERFFTDGHASVVGLTVCRCLQFLVKEPVNSHELEVALYLEADILKGYSEFGFAPDKNLLEHINDIIQLLTTASDPECSAKITIASAVVLCSFLSIAALKLKESTGRLLFENMKRCFSSLSSLCHQHSVDPLVDRTIDAASALSAHVCRFLLSAFDGDHPFANCEEQADTVRMVSDFAVCIALPHIMKLPQQEIKSFPEKVTSLFQSLTLLLQESLTGQNRTLAHSLCETGLLPFIVQTLPLADERDTEKLRSTSRNLLSTLLITLSLDIFSFPEMWSEGEDHFKAEVASGVQSLPVDPHYWLHSLCDPSQHRSVVLVILLYLFYLILVEGNFSGNDTFIAVSEFLDQVTGLGSCPLLLKIVWPVLALSQVNVPDEELAEGFEPAVAKLVLFLQEQKDLQLVYTHHPGILYHAFHSDKFPHSLQLQLVRLWLMNEPKNEETLTELLKTSERARFAVLDLVLSAEEPLLTSAFDAYSSLLSDQNSDEQATTVWHLLPNTLSKICGNAISASNVERLIELALLRLPQVWDSLELNRAAGLVPAAIASLSPVPLPMWNLAHRILTQHIGQTDYRVATYYMRSAGFLQKLLTNIGGAESPEITQTSLKMAALLNLVQRKEKEIPKIQCSIILDPERVLRLLQAPEPETRRRALFFIQELLDSQWDPPICRLGGPPSAGLIRYLFFLLHNYCIEESSDEVWECLGSCLRLFPPDHPLTTHLANTPWLSHLLEVSLPLLHQQQAMVTFIEDWLSLYRPPKLCSRRLSTPLHFQTLALVARELEGHVNPAVAHLLKEVLDLGIELPVRASQENPLKRKPSNMERNTSEAAQNSCLEQEEPHCSPDLAEVPGIYSDNADVLNLWESPEIVAPARSPNFSFLSRITQTLAIPEKPQEIQRNVLLPAKRKSQGSANRGESQIGLLF